MRTLPQYEAEVVAAKLAGHNHPPDPTTGKEMRVASQHFPHFRPGNGEPGTLNEQLALARLTDQPKPFPDHVVSRLIVTMHSHPVALGRAMRFCTDAAEEEDRGVS